MDAAQYSFNEDLFRERLKQAIEKKNYSKADLSRKTGVSAATIGNYVNGNRTPRGFGDIVPVAKALNVSVDYLAGVVDYNYLDDCEKGGSSSPQTYYDAVRMINALNLAFLTKSSLMVGTGDSVQIILNDSDLAEYMRQQNQLFDMLGRSLSDRAFAIAFDDLNDKMKGHPIPEEYSSPF